MCIICKRFRTRYFGAVRNCPDSRYNRYSDFLTAVANDCNHFFCRGPLIENKFVNLRRGHDCLPEWSLAGAFNLCEVNRVSKGSRALN